MATTIQTTSEQPTTSLGIHENTVPVADPNLLISGDYTRLGDDLILTGSDGARFHVEDYFAGQSQPTLVGSDGAKVTGDVVKILAGPQFPGQYAQATAPDGAESIGKVATLNGTATATRANGVKVELKQGDPVFKGDVVETGKGAELGITFVDETVFSLSAEARMVLNELVYQPGGQSNSMLFNLVKGTFGFVSGKIAPSGEMDIQTPVAIMAIRGTAPIVELNIGADGNQVKVDGKFFLAVVKGHSGIVHLLDPETRELKAILDDPLKGITISGADGITTFDLTVADLFFVQTLVQNRIEPLLESLDPEGGPEDLIKKIKNSFDDIFNLLGDTGLGGATLTLSVTDADGDPLTIAFTPSPAGSSNGVPTAGTISITIDVEDNEGGDGDIDAGTGSTNETVVGALPINFGLDGPGGINFASLSGTAVTDTAGRTVTSGGEVVTYSFSGNTLTASTPSGVVFQVVINDVASGTFTVRFFEPLDEPISGTEDEITLSLPFQVIDGNGSTATGTLVITVDDDTAEIGSPEAALVDEDDLPVGNMDTQTGDDAPITNAAIDTDSDNTTVGGALNISFGSDDSNTVVNGGSPAGPGDRAVTFAANAIATLTALGLTSEGDALSYAITGNGTVLTATAGGRTIFTVTLSDTGSGSYVFDLEDTLDHSDPTTEDNIDLTFNFTATDSDGDSEDGSFTVAVDDDGPAIGTPDDALVDEDDLAGPPNDLATGNNNDVAVGDDTTVTNASIDTDSDETTVGGSLDIDFGADDANAVVDGGTPSGDGDRAVTFNVSTITALDLLNLTSEGDPIAYGLSPDGTVLTATATAGGRTIFTVTLSDTDNGSYIFDLVDAIDHPDPFSEDDIDLAFDFIATDSDGDTAGGSFTVTVDDDAPKLTGTIENTVEEEALASGNEDTLDADGNDTDIASDLNVVSAVATGSLQGMVTVGADEVTGVTGGASFALSADTLDLPVLTSGGEAVAYDVTGDTLTAYVDGIGGTPGQFDPADSIIFTLQVQANGDYTFTLNEPLDHFDPTPGATASDEETLALDFSSIIIPTDQDGDAISVTSAFTINVIDDVPVIGTSENALVDEDDLAAGNMDSATGDDATVTNATIDTDSDDTTVGGSLNIDFGADAANAVVDGGIPAGDGDRAVTFSADAVATLAALALTSAGELITYSLSPDEAVLTATADGETVFTATLSDDGNGSYIFDLSGPIDHPAGLSENDVDLTFNFTATDSDGDSADGSFTVTVDDDLPVATASTLEGIVEEEALIGGNEDTGDAGGKDTDPSPEIGTIASGSLQPLVSVGGDDTAAGADKADFSLSTTVTDLSLTSNGETVKYDISGNTLTAYVDVAGGTAGQFDSGTDQEIFTLVVESDGDFTFTLKGQLDHGVQTTNSAPSSEEILTLDLSPYIVATDADGDSITLTSGFTISVIDDVPVANADTDSVLEDGSADDATGNVLTGVDITGTPDTNTTDGVADQAGADLALAVSGVQSINGSTPTIGIVGSPLNGEFGTLTLNADGSYVYKLDNGNTTVDALNAGQTVQDVFEYTATDADGDSVTTTLTVTIDGANDVPVVDLNGADTGTGFSASFTEDGGLISIVDSLNLTVGDVDNSMLSSATITLTNRPDGPAESLTVNTGATGISAVYTPATGVLALTGSATLADYQQVLRSLGYDNSSENPDTADRTVTVVVNDGTADSASATAIVSVDAVNDDPAAANLPSGDLLVLQGVPKNLELQNITFSDADLGTGDLTFSIEVTDGSLFAAIGGPSGAVVTGNGTQTVTVTGTITEVETYLDTIGNVSYTSGTTIGDDVATITLKLSDNGNTGTGGGGDITLFTAHIDVAPLVESFDAVPPPFAGSVSSFTSGALDYAFDPVGDGGVFKLNATGGIGGSTGLELTSNPPTASPSQESVTIKRPGGADFTFESMHVSNPAIGADVTITGLNGGIVVFTQVVSSGTTLIVDPAGPPVIDEINLTSLNFDGFVIDDLELNHLDDPIILDLGAEGIDLTSAVDGVRFDIDADGTKDAIGWTSGEDGILVMDLDGSGAIENGREVFSPDFGDGGFTDSLEALASLDENGDGRIDANDTAYDDLLIWVDANHDGISQDDELASLLDHGIASIDLGAETSNEQINGQQVLSEGQFTLISGETKSYVAVGFESLDIPSINHAPELSGSHDLGAVASHDANTGTVVADLVSDLASDADPNTDVGIAVTAAQTQGSGTWQYRSADGSFVNFPAIALGAAFLLAFDMIVRFVPDATAQTTDPDAAGHIETPPALTFHAWDGSAGEAGEIVDIGATGVGGQTPFSTAEAMSSVEIAAEPVTGRFTDDDDTVDLNSVVPDGDGDGPFADAGAGNDTVILPDIDAPLSEQLAGQTFYGGAGDDIIVGGDGDDIIDGGDGNDLISGGAGDDILAGGLGFDTLTGGEGADTFVLSHLDAADLIADYDFSAGDEIDLSGLFTVYSDGSEGTDQDDLSDFVRVVENGDGAVDQLQVDVDGGGDSFVSVASINADSGVSITYSDDSSAASTNSGVV